MVMLEILSLIFGGGMTGLFGSLINRSFSFVENKQKLAHEVRLQEMNIQARGMELEREAEIAESSAAAEIRKASYSHDMSASNVDKWVNNVLRLVRPTLTLFFIGLVVAIWYELTPDDVGMREHIIHTVTYLTTVCITWWFGSRDLEKQNKLPWR